KDWRMYNEILGRNIGEPDARNFLAHSGFEGNVVEVKKENGKLLLRYRQDKLGTIMDLCKKGLK
ncbi:MAG: TIGR01897 family CRISPR-associated protein, partial [Thermoprotei archaeon]